ncbi:LuxR C-terminal-related transcriptional regulator [Kitasatospora sp. NPDC093102]|uniref:helix-turn-helix transcriptional regulator n=1 Tax=Kitasatospora sp. NPDC093102 TaxID=3155069 RepID=UPI003420DA8E
MLGSAVDTRSARVNGQTQPGRPSPASPAGNGRTDSAATAWRSYAAVASAALGDRSEGLRLVREEVAVAQLSGDAARFGVALLTQAVINSDDDLAGVARAVDALRGGRERRPGADPRHVRAFPGRNALLTQALERVRSVGHPVLAGQLERMAPTHWNQDEKRPEFGPDSLSPHERRLTAMVLDGLTNDDIATKLSVSRRAVEFHFTRIYRKLGITRRAQLHAALGRAGRPAVI